MVAQTDSLKSNNPSTEKLENATADSEEESEYEDDEDDEEEGEVTKKEDIKKIEEGEVIIHKRAESVTDTKIRGRSNGPAEKSPEKKVPE